MSRLVVDNDSNQDNKTQDHSTNNDVVQLGKELSEKYFSHHPSNILRMNNGSFGACPSHVLEKVAEERNAWLKCPDVMWGSVIPVKMGEARAAVAKYVAHCDVKDIVIIENVTVCSTMMSNWLVDDILKVAISEETMKINPGPYVILTTNFNYNAVKTSHEAAKQKLKAYNINLVIEKVDISFPLKKSSEVTMAYVCICLNHINENLTLIPQKSLSLILVR